MSDGVRTTPNVVSFLRRSAAVAPDWPAVATPDGAASYRELLAWVEAVAATLPSAAEGSEAIAVIGEHDHVIPSLYLGVMAAGHSLVPLSPRIPDQAIARIVARAGARIGLLAPSAAPRSRSIVDTADRTAWRAYGDVPDASLPPRSRVMPEGTAMVCFTSGTSGVPKGVMLTHENLIVHGLTAALVYRFGHTNVHINPMPLAHFAGASRVVLATVNAGTHVILPCFSPDAVFEAITAWGGTHLMVVPTMADDLLDNGPERHDLESLEMLIYGAAPMHLSLAGDLVARFGCGLVHGYGLTESAALATALGPEAHLAASAAGELLGTVGQPVPGIELKIFDDRDHEVEVGVAGQIALRGAKVSPGYLDDPETTAERFLPDGWLLTGDLGRLTPGGDLALLGRIDEMMITGGINVQPLEIENEVRLLPEISDCAAFGVASQRWGQEIHLAVVSSPGSTIDPERIRTHLRSRLDPFKVPRHVHLIESLPRTSVGKVQRFRLAELVEPARAPDADT